MDHVVDDAPDTHLFIVGWGELESELRTEVETRGLGDKVTVTGKVPTVHEYYALSDVFVSSSILEGMPIAHLEAMTAELPIVATDIPGVREVVTDGENGYLVSPGDPEMFARAMIDCLPPDRRNQFSRASYSRAAADFSIDRTVDAHLSLYRELLEPS
jgi:glycosyltransferase involved in cell wall biosynthesis